MKNWRTCSNFAYIFALVTLHAFNFHNNKHVRSLISLNHQVEVDRSYIFMNGTWFNVTYAYGRTIHHSHESNAAQNSHHIA